MYTQEIMFRLLKTCNFWYSRLIIKVCTKNGGWGFKPTYAPFQEIPISPTPVELDKMLWYGPRNI
jgi:hypothetical protein